ncbi:MAG: acetyl-CoA carboxylase biotin carboxylase subunit family protein [Anaerorhabdus sp.]
MKCLIIGASNEAVHAIESSKKYGFEVYVLDGNENAHALKMGDHYKVLDISDKEKTLEYAKENEIDFILPVPIGKCLTTIGYCNDKLNLPGISYEASISCTDKYLFHKCLNKKNLRNNECFLLEKKDKFSNIKLDFDNKQYILKPRDGSGSRDIQIISNEKDITSLGTFDEDMILEEMFLGEEFGVDAIIHNNKLKLVLLRGKKNINNQSYMYYSIQENKLYKVVEDKMSEVCNALNINNCIVHADIMIEDATVNVIEISGRPSGHSLSSLFSIYASGIDMYKEITDIYTNNYIDKKMNIKKIFMYYFNFQNYLVSSVPCIDDFSCSLYTEMNIKPGDLLSTINQGTDIIPRGKIIMPYTEINEIDKEIEKINSKFGGKHV